MGFVAFDYKGKRHWLGDGNARTARDLEAEKKTDVLDEFLKTNSVAVTTTKEVEFKHPFEQTFPAAQIRPNFGGEEKGQDDKEDKEDKHEDKDKDKDEAPAYTRYTPTVKK